MIINLVQGGMSIISVTAPTGANVSATCLGLTVTGTGECSLEVPIIGTWSLTCVYNGVTKTDSVAVTTFGASYPVTFFYGSIIRVTTHPGASVSATKTGQDTLTGTADSSGMCDLLVPYTGLGLWSVTADNGTTTASETVDVSAYDLVIPVSLLTNVPVIEFTVDGTTYTYEGVEIDIANKIKISPSGSNWKMWVRKSGTLIFRYLGSSVDVCLVGPGGDGGYAYGSYEYGYGAGGGGGGGAVNRLLGTTLAVDTEYAVTISSSRSVLGSLLTSGKGEAGGSGGGNSGGNSGDGGRGDYINDHTYPATYIGYGSGGGGVYAFDNSSSFDNVKYANGGGGGSRAGHSGGAVYNTPGSGGAGGGDNSSGRTNGLNGILLMRNHT